ncbi:nucleoside hydrolase [Polyangium jinanense]|uniref:nucleoside hydrolase n=1 Tax=Polyangium jinanense TaxID=2829994 RepID=UPI0023402610|nr:nucleoside hydrolase [Polyangium jinanense]
MLRQIVIDTDAGWDDWLALLFLMKCPEIEILGVTVTGVGEAHLTPGMTNMQRLLVFGGQSANVYPGAQKPLLYSNVFPASFRATIDSFWGVSIPPPPGRTGTSTISTTSAVDFLYQTFAAAAARGKPVDMLCIGGFTNLATLLAERPLPEFQAGIGTIYAMAGAVGVPGNVYDPGDATWGYYDNTKAEWNVFVDAKAAEIALRAGLRIVLVPLDATNHVPVTTAYVNAYGSAAGSDVYAGFVYTLLQLQAGETNFFDPLAAAVLRTQSAKDLVTTAPFRLEVSTGFDEEDNTTGALTPTADPAFPEVVVCTSANATTFEGLFSSATLPRQG